MLLKSNGAQAAKSASAQPASRALSVFLSVVLVVSMVPINAFLFAGTALEEGAAEQSALQEATQAAEEAEVPEAPEVPEALDVPEAAEEPGVAEELDEPQAAELPEATDEFEATDADETGDRAGELEGAEGPKGAQEAEELEAIEADDADATVFTVEFKTSEGVLDQELAIQEVEEFELLEDPWPGDIAPEDFLGWSLAQQVEIEDAEAAENAAIFEDYFALETPVVSDMVLFAWFMPEATIEPMEAEVITLDEGISMLNAEPIPSIAPQWDSVWTGVIGAPLANLAGAQLVGTTQSSTNDATMFWYVWNESTKELYVFCSARSNQAPSSLNLGSGTPPSQLVFQDPLPVPNGSHTWYRVFKFQFESFPETLVPPKDGGHGFDGNPIFFVSIIAPPDASPQWIYDGTPHLFEIPPLSVSNVPGFQSVSYTYQVESSPGVWVEWNGGSASKSYTNVSDSETIRVTAIVTANGASYSPAYYYISPKVLPREIIVKPADEVKIEDGSPLKASRLEIAASSPYGLVDWHELSSLTEDDFDGEITEPGQEISGIKGTSGSKVRILDDSFYDYTSNYTISFTTGTLTVLEKRIEVELDTLWVRDANKVYGSPDPTFSSDFVEGWPQDVLPAHFDIVVTRQSGDNVGQYSINATVTVKPEYADLYDVLPGAIAPGTFTITKKQVTVVAADKTKVYGEADPELTAAVEGVLEGDVI
ncbi:MAG: hypothetical protein FWD27_08450, partial [Coriobacteriia bacterium]|nr:hypothetical protein [Coriobacteriia bacterium]